MKRLAKLFRIPLFQPCPPDTLDVAGRPVPLSLVRNPRARRYVLRLTSEGSARVTVPRGGSVTEARRFVERSKGWLEQALQKQAQQPARARQWNEGTHVLVRGASVPIECLNDGAGKWVRFGDQTVRVAADATDYRLAIEKHLWRLAARELPLRVNEFAAQHQIKIQRISVRNQRTRWGSCSRRGTISLNWRLIQTPPHVQDYIILHELMHCREMNHSARFWREVKSVCPGFELAERWLKQNAALLRP